MQGVGKTLFAVSIARKYIKNNLSVYSNSYIKNTFQLPLNWYDYKYEKNSLIILDEAQLNYNCRDYSTKERQEMYKKILTYLTMCRHYDIEIVFITQSINRLDVQIRDLATDIYRLRKSKKIPIFYYSFKNKKIIFKKIPILQSGRYFEDSADLDRYLNCTSENYKDYGRKFLKFVNLKCLGMYFTDIKDKNYLEKDFPIKNYWSLDNVILEV